MPGRKWYRIALLLILVGGALAGLVIYSRLSGLADHVPQIVVPGDADLTLSRPGTYTIYLERDAVVNGRLYSTTDAIQEMRSRISSTGGSPIEMSAPSVYSNYSIGGRSGRAVLAFTISDPGQYHFRAGYPDGSIEPQGVLAVGFGVPEMILSTILQGMAIAGTAFVLGVSVAIITLSDAERCSVKRPPVRPARRPRRNQQLEHVGRKQMICDRQLICVVLIALVAALGLGCDGDDAPAVTVDQAQPAAESGAAPPQTPPPQTTPAPETVRHPPKLRHPHQRRRAARQRHRRPRMRQAPSPLSNTKFRACK